MFQYDVIVAGGGVSGFLTALKLKRKYEDWKIAILEKESFWGGRARSSLDTNILSCGLNLVSSSVIEFFNECFDEDTGNNLLEESNFYQVKKVGICSAGDVTSLDFSELFYDKGIRAIGGASALRDWKKRLEGLDEKIESQNDRNTVFSKIYPISRKDPSGVVLDIFAHMLGIPSLPSSFFSCFAQRLQEAQKGLYLAHWSDILARICSEYEGRIDFYLQALIVSSSYNKDSQYPWSLKSQQGQFETKRLIVAQSIWDTISWLDQSQIPTELLSVGLKAKPVSVVSLTHKISRKDLKDDTGTGLIEDDVLLVPSEQVLVTNTANNLISYSVPLDYELFFEAPSVSKAVRRLKRAKKKLMSIYPDLQASGDFISLIPSGWTQIITPQSRVIEEASSYSRQDLWFCGDNYGVSFCPDENIISSVSNICSNI